ncbi:MAG TPA: hypothetical protein VL122_03705 [Nitrospirota bacterium]|nr:hypothetical protein [Nitrospirota bacterium]
MQRFTDRPARTAVCIRIAANQNEAPACTPLCFQAAVDFEVAFQSRSKPPQEISREETKKNDVARFMTQVS